MQRLRGARDLNAVERPHVRAVVVAIGERRAVALPAYSCRVCVTGAHRAATARPRRAYAFAATFARENSAFVAGLGPVPFV